MSHFRFVPKVEYVNDLLIPLGLYPKISVPSGVSARHPDTVDSGKFATILRSQPAPLVSSGSSPLGVKALTRAYFFLRFPDFAGQWASSGSSGRRFQGGDVELCVAIKIYLVDSRKPNAPGADGCTLAAFAVILEHEYKHVKDNVDIVKEQMPQIARRNPDVRRLLIEQKPLTEAECRTWINGYARTRTLSDALWTNPYPPGVGLELSLLPDWAAEHNKRGDALDASTGTEMTRYSTRLDDLSRRHQLGRHWKGGPGSDPWRD